MDPCNGWDIVGQNPETTQADLDDAIAEIKAAKAVRAAKIRGSAEPEPEPEAEAEAVARDADVWKREFASDVGEGHASKTMQLVQAIVALPVDSSIICELGLQPLHRELSDRGATAPQRNRALRDWLGQSSSRAAARWGELTARWDELGFPAAPPAQSQPSCCVVFDFDSTLSTCDVGWQHMEDPANRAFGGPERVALLRHMLEQLAELGAHVSILSFNSSHTIRKTLEKLSLLALLRGDHTGRSDKDCVVGCEDYNRRATSRGGGASRQGRGKISKSSEINTRWVGVSTDAAAAGSKVAPEQLLFVDDDPNNIEDVRENCGGARVHHVAGPRGMTAEDCTAILEWAVAAAGTAPGC